MTKKIVFVGVFTALSACASTPLYKTNDSETASLKVSVNPAFGSSGVTAYVYAKESENCDSKEMKLGKRIGMVKGEENNLEVSAAKEFFFQVTAWPAIGEESVCRAKFQPVRNKQYESTIRYTRDKGCYIEVIEKGARENIAEKFTCR